MAEQTTHVATPVKPVGGKNRKPYFWGRLFVRLAVVLSILALLLTVFLCLHHFLSMRRQVAERAFRPDPGLATRVDRAADEYGQTMRVFVAIYPDTVLGKEFSVEFPRKVADKNDLDALLAVTNAVRGNLATLRKGVLDALNEPSQVLIDGMKQKAGRVKQGIVGKNQGEVAKCERRIEQLMRRMNPAVSFYEPMDEGECRDRLWTVQHCRDLLQGLYDMTDSKVAHAKMEKCNRALMAIEDAFPEPLSERVLEKLNAEIQQEREKLAALRGGGGKMKGEEMAAELEARREAVNLAFASSWKLDGALDAVDAAVMEGLDRQADCQKAQHGITADSLMRIVWSALSGVGFAFSLLVCADFLRAHFDTAEYARCREEVGLVG